MNQPSPVSESEISGEAFQKEVERLHRITVYARWSIVGVLWLTIGVLSLWGLRYPISLMRDYFTWSALRYGLAFHRLPAIGLAICIGSTVGVLFWQSRNILMGLPNGERKSLEQQVCRIRQQGPSHPLWKFVCQRQG